MKENFIKLTTSLIGYLVAASAAVAILFFLPTTPEFFEFNKLTALLVITALALVLWAVRMVVEQKATFTRTPLDVPLLILVAVFFVASLSGIDQFLSFFGTGGKLWPTFLPLVSLVILYFVTTANVTSKKQVNLILWAVATATTVASAVAIVSYFGLFLPFDFARIRSFNTVGIINRLAVLQAFIIPLTFSWAIYSRDKNIRAVATVFTLVMAFSFVLINLPVAYIPLAAGLLFATAGTLKHKLDKNQQGTLAIIAAVAILFLVLRFLPQVARGTLYAWIVAKDPALTEQQQIATPKEKTLPARAAWDISASAIGKRPLFGAGPGTYAFVFSQLKPRYLNALDDWAIRFDKSNSDFTELIATTGVFGILVYLLLVVAILRFIWALVFKSENSATYLALSSAVIAALVASFTSSSSFATTSVFFIILALLSALAKVADESHVYDVTVELATLKSKFAWFPLGTPSADLIKTTTNGKGGKSQVLPIIFLIVCAAAVAYALYYQINAYRAEYYFRQSNLAALANDGGRTINFLQRALAANTRVDTYHRALSQTALNAAINLAARPNLSDNERQALAQLAQVAIDQGKVASGYQILPLRLPGIAASNVANWETLSAAYQVLIGSVGGADVHATNTLAQAVALDPENPVLHDRLGQLYQRLNNLDLAQRKFEDSVIVKSDYGPGRYRLAKILIERKGEILRIVNELSTTKRFLDANDPAIPEVDKLLEEYNQKLRQQQTQTQASPSPSPSPRQSPSPTPSPSPSPLPSPGL